ncbi:MAG: AsmA family protein [Pseudomonadota bacterium]
MKIVKYLLYGAGGLAALVILAAGAAVVVVDGAFVKARLERAMQEKNRTLVIEGEPKLRLFPVAGIALGRTTLTEPGSDKVFVALESADVAVRTMPLLSGEVEVEKLSLAGLRAQVVKGKDGNFNFADLAGPERPREEGKRGAPPNVKVAEINIERLRLDYRDEASGQEATLSDFDLKTGRLDGATPGPVSLAARITGKKPDLDLRAQASGALRFDLGRQEIAFDGFSFGAKGKVDRDTFAAEFSAPRVEVTPAKASGSDVKGTVQVKGPQRSANLVFRIQGIEGTARDLSLSAVALDLDAAAAGNSVKGKVSTPVKGNLEARTWELPRIAANLTFSGPAIPQKSVTLPVSASAQANLEKQTAGLELSTKFDETSINAKFGASRFDPLVATFDVGIDKLDLDRYLPAQKKEAKTDERIDLSGLKGKTVSGKFAAGALTVKRVRLQNVKAEVKLAGGKLEVAPHSASLYGGSLSGNASIDSNGNRVAAKESIQGVQVGPLLRDAAQKDVLEGRGNVSLDVQTAGGTVTALKKALAGSARVEMKDGAVKGINLADSARNLKSALGGKVSKPDAGQKTDFSEMSASFRIKSGVARNDDLKAQSPFLRLGGAGDLDIGNNTIDYLAKASLVATSRGQGGRELGQVAGITVPVKLSGALDNPSWSVDYSGLAGGALGKAAGGITDAAKKGASGIGDKLRGLFGR